MNGWRRCKRGDNERATQSWKMMTLRRQQGCRNALPQERSWTRPVQSQLRRHGDSANVQRPGAKGWCWWMGHHHCTGQGTRKALTAEQRPQTRPIQSSRMVAPTSGAQFGLGFLATISLSHFWTRDTEITTIRHGCERSSISTADVIGTNRVAANVA